MKGFNIAPTPPTNSLPPVAEFIASLQQSQSVDQSNLQGTDFFGSTLSNIFGSHTGSTPRKSNHHHSNHHHHHQQVSRSQNSISDDHTYHHSASARSRFQHSKRTSVTHKRRWGTLIEAARSGRVSRFIGRSRSEDSVCNSTCCQEDGHSHCNSPASDENVTETPSDSNPSLDTPDETQIPHHNNRRFNIASFQHHSLGAGALAALRKKRKKFSASRNTSPVTQSKLSTQQSITKTSNTPQVAQQSVVPPSTTSSIEQAIASVVSKRTKKVLKRASSVPTRVTEVVQMVMASQKHDQTQSQQQSVEIPGDRRSRHGGSHGKAQSSTANQQQTLTPSTTEESVTNAGRSRQHVSKIIVSAF